MPPTDRVPASARPAGPRFAKWKRLFRGRPRAILLRPPSETPSVVLACEHCGFDYAVTRIDFDEGRVGALWTCACGTRYIPPGGEESFNLVRP